MITIETTKEVAIITLNTIWANIAAILGIGGFILGVVNLMRSIQSERVKLSVEPSLAYYVGTGDQLLSFSNNDNFEDHLKRNGLPIIAIQVTNLSKFAVTIYDIGFSSQHPDHGGRSPILRPPNNEELPWPTRLEPRASVTYRTEIPIIEYPFTLKTRAYAKTTCGYAALGDSPAFKAWRTLSVNGRPK